MFAIETANKKNMNKKERLDLILQYSIIVLLFIIPLTRAGTNILVSLIALLWIAKKIFFKDKADSYFELKRWIFIYGIIIALSLINAVDLQYGIRTLFSKYIKYAIIFIATLETIKKPQQFKKMWLTLPISGIITSSYGIYEYFILNSRRIVSTYNNPNPTGTAMMMIALLSISFILFSKGKLNKILGIICASLSSLALILTYSRGAWLGFILALIILLILCIKEYKLLSFKIITICLLVLVIVGVYFAPQDVSNRFYSMTELDSSSINHRLIQYEVALEMFRNHPLIGIGFGQFRPAFPNYLEMLGYDIRLVSKVHNVYLNIIAELGALGFLGFLILIYKLLKIIKSNWIKSSNLWFQYGMIGLFVGVGIHSLFDHTFFQVQVGTYLIILTAIWLNNLILQNNSFSDILEEKR